MKIEKSEYTIYKGDCIQIMAEEMEPESVDLAIFSPPFASLYAYSGLDADMGNSKESDEEFLLHYDFFAKELTRVIKPGRNVNVHIMDMPRFLEWHGYVGIYDLRGDIIRIFEQYGLHLYRSKTINKNPQSQAIRSHSITLSFAQWDKDSAMSAGALADYLLIFKKDGENKIPVKPRGTREDWINWAAPCWTDIRETYTLSVAGSKDDRDEKHVCPLQLDVIERVIRWQCNPDEIVFSPFMGIGSEGYEAIRLGNRFIGIELKKSYFDQAIKNLNKAISIKKQKKNLLTNANPKRKRKRKKRN